MRGARRTASRVGVLVACWLAVVAVGWAGYYAAGGGAAARSAADARASYWLVGVPVAVLAATVLVKALERRAPPSAPVALIPLAAGGWGLADAVGWTVDVTVGGPVTGLVTGAVLVSVAPGAGRPQRARLVAVVVVAVAALVGGRLVAGGDDLAPRTLLPIAVGLVAAGMAWRFARLRSSYRPVAASMVVWWAAWLIGFAVSKLLDTPSVQVVVEVGLACTAGGAASWLLLARGCGERIGAVVVRWAMSAVAGTVLGMLIAAALWEVGLAPTGVLQPSDLWAAGTTFGLGLAGAVALWPTMSALSTGPAERVAAPPTTSRP
jgi:hypothetical protein